MNPEDKPITMPLRDWLIKRIAISKNIPSAVIEAIITHQFDSANAATYIHKSLEISGFGRFVFSDAKAVYMMNRYKEQIRVLTSYLGDGVHDSSLMLTKIEGVNKSIRELKKRMP